MISDSDFLFAKIPQQRWARYVIALGALAISFAAAFSVRGVAGEFAVYVPVLAAITFSAFYCGYEPASLVIALSIVGTRYWFIEPRHSLHAPAAPHLISLAAFAVASAVIVAIGEANRRNMLTLLAAQAELDERVQQRTAALAETHRSLREVTARLMNSQDEERRRLARELHDSAGQTLAALSMNLSTVTSDLERLKKTAKVVTDSTAIVRELTDNIRTMSYLLHPPLLDEAGLAFALRWYCEGFAERSKIRVEMDIPEDFGRLPHDQEIALFRVVQESLTNIHRHAESPVAKIALERRAADVCVEIEDKGKGISAADQQSMAASGTPGVGIRGMRERLLQLGGTLDIHSLGPGKGTRVIAKLPHVAPEAEPPPPAAKAATFVN